MSKTGKPIKHLPPEVINLVAAGEVIEHPASVVKELVENSLDAEASEISIEIEALGLGQIRVVDNGTGIGKDDLIEALKRHTTSKISEITDLNNLSTLGFRGEGLYSIDSVSKLSLKSKVPDSLAGYELCKDREGLFAIRPVGMPTGTVVTVQELFFNVPGRKNYYRHKNHIIKAITEVVTNLALASPDIGFRLKVNDKVTLHVPKGQDTFSRISYLLGEDISKTLLPIAHEETHFRLQGYVSKPQGALHSDEFQYLFVNGRPVKHPPIVRLVKEVFGSLIEVKAHPVFIFSLSVPASMVDANVHPRKQEVLFINSDFVYNNIQSALYSVLGLNDLTYRKESFDLYADAQDVHKSNSYLASSLKESTTTWNYKLNSRETPLEVLQIHNLYLAFENAVGMTIIDQHAAHERILFEDFLDQFKRDKLNIELIEKNVLVDVPITLVPLLENSIQTLSKVGFTIEHFRNNTFKITLIPKIYGNHDMKALLIEFLYELEKSNTLKDSDQDSLKTISYLACRSAIKAGDYLTMQERRNLVEKLIKTKSSYTCPHGRPVEVELSLTELGKMFKRL